MENIIFDMRLSCLGDELSMYRNCLLDLFFQRKITKDVVIYCSKDRSFLYSNIFSNVINREDSSIEIAREFFEKKTGKKYECISIESILLFPNGDMWDSLHKNIIITKPNIFNYERYNYYNSKNHSGEFKQLICNINFLEKLPKFNNENFIVYHHRIKKDGAWDSKLKTLQIFLDSLEKKKIVIFSQEDLNYEHPNLYVTKNLQEYASFMNSERCLAVFSVWSGGGQFASYCSGKNTKLFMHFDDMQCQKVDDKLQEFIDSEMAFDFAQFTDVKRTFIKEEDIKDIIFSDIYNV